MIISIIYESKDKKYRAEISRVDDRDWLIFRLKDGYYEQSFRSLSLTSAQSVARTWMKGKKVKGE